eukprot:174735-Ditylum_brightwellii.AAC.1
MIRLAKKGIIPSALKYIKKAPPCAAYLFANAQRKAWRTRKKQNSSIRKKYYSKPGKGISADHMISHKPVLIP